MPVFLIAPFPPPRVNVDSSGPPPLVKGGHGFQYKESAHLLVPGPHISALLSNFNQHPPFSFSFSFSFSFVFVFYKLHKTAKT
jgi:hypothetical protein